MKAEAKLAFLFFLTGTFAVAQIAQGTFKHIIIVVQENRSPDNLIGAAAGPNPSCGSEYDFEPGVDIDNGQANDQQGQPNPTCNASTPLALHCDPSHGHIDFNNMYDGVNNHYMDGACGSKFGGNCVGACPQYAYVPRSDVSEYFQIAGNYGFANYTCFKPTRGRAFLPISSFLPAPRPPSLTRTQASIGRGSTRGIR